MNMKQSCKALICAIEGELDGRHCTEEQAAAILDHALPSLTEALARVEAERDALKYENAELAGSIELEDASNYYRERQLKAQLAEVVGILQTAMCEPACVWFGRAEAFLTRHAQAEQQEAPKRGKPDWNSHGYDQIFQTSDGNWFGARAGWDFKGHISDEWKGREVSLLRDDGAFLAYGEPNPDWENSLEQRPAKEAQGAQASEFQREDRYIVIKRKDLGAVPLEVRESLGVALFQLSKHLPKRECLVIESDWSEYEPTWAAIQARVTCQGGDERSHFEKWFFETNNISLDEYPHWNARDELGEYRSGVVDVAWGVWQARAALANQPAAGEPVAWRYRTHSNGPWYVTTKQMHASVFDRTEDGGQVQGLFTGTAPAAVRGAEHE